METVFISAIHFSRGDKEMKCECGQKEDMKHIYKCEIYNEEQVNLPYKKIYNGSINEQIAVFREFEQNLQKRQQLRTKIDLFFHTESSGPPLPMHDCNCNILYLESVLINIFAHVPFCSPGHKGVQSSRLLLQTQVCILFELYKPVLVPFSLLNIHILE